MSEDRKRAVWKLGSASFFRGVVALAALGSASAVRVEAQTISALAPAEEESEEARQHRVAQETTAVLQVSPAPPPVPALKYEFFRRRQRLRDENAATHYFRALVHLAELPPDLQKEYADKFEAWRGASLSAEARKEIETWLAAHEPVLRIVEQAAECAHCRWHVLSGARNLRELYSLNLHEFQQMRTILRVIELRAHLAIEEDRFDDAVRAIGLGFRVATDIGEEPVLITGLIGVAGVAMMQQQVEHLMGRPGAPNLYWALATLPAPIVDLRAAVDQEMSAITEGLVSLRDAENLNRSRDEWERIVAEDIATLDQFGGQPTNPLLLQAAALGIVMRGYPKSRQGLLDAGFAPEVLDKMAPSQVVAIYQSRLQRRFTDEVRAAMLLPPVAGAAALAKIDMKELRDKEALPVMSLLMPAVGAVQQATLRIERRHAALRTIESLRAHAAAHGRFPDTLGGLELPAPDDVWTGAPFAAEMSPQRVVLRLVPSRDGDPHSGRTFELTLPDPQ